MSETHPVPRDFQRKCFIDADTYEDMYRRSVEDSDAFWAEQAEQHLDWYDPWHTVSEADFETGRFAWFAGGHLNAAYNCIDRHLATRGEQTAIIWEGDDPNESKSITYNELYAEVCKLANALKSRGVGRGDRVCIYMPMIPEAAYAMLACARIGAIHSVVFGGFSPQSLKDRILDSDCQTLITADQGVRGGRPVPLKENAEQALEDCPNVHTVVTVKRTGAQVPWNRTATSGITKSLRHNQPIASPR